MNGSCYETSTSTSPAASPAFEDENYEWGSGKYSTWTESVWQKLEVRIFLQASRTHQILTFSFGIVVFALSIVIFSWINRKTDILFNSRYAGYSPVPPNC
jgi:nicastrin